MLGQLKNHRKATNATCISRTQSNAPESANFKAEARRKLVDLACFEN